MVSHIILEVVVEMRILEQFGYIFAVYITRRRLNVASLIYFLSVAVSLCLSFLLDMQAVSLTKSSATFLMIDALSLDALGGFVLRYLRSSTTYKNIQL